MRVFLLALLLSAYARAEAPRSPLSLFEAVVDLHYQECKECERPVRGLPSRRIIARHMAGIEAACDRFWPGNEEALYRMLGLLISEGNGIMKDNSPKGEKTHGPYCESVEEVREVAGKGSLHPDIPCPRSAVAIIEKLETEPEWAALVCAAIVKQYDREQGGDQIRGTLVYKIGGARLKSIVDDHPGVAVTNIRAWKEMAKRMDYVRCLRDRLMIGNTPLCGCPAP